MNASTLSQCLYHARRITTLVHTWDNLRGPGMAMPPEEINQHLAKISPIEITHSQISDEHLIPLLERMQKAERVLINTLKDPVYLNDDRDREIIAARMTLCNILKQLRDLDPHIHLVNHLWEQNDGEEWCTV